VALSTKLPFPIIACVLLHASTSVGQTLATAGAITGTVTDTAGSAVAGTIVVLTSDSLMRSRTVSTNLEGVYRIAAIPSGEYSLMFTRHGFATRRRDAVRVSIGFTATVNAVLEIAGLYDHVIVEPGASAIDRHSTAIAANFDAGQLADLPNSRSLFTILAATPAVHVARFEVGGSSGDAGGPYGVYGTVGSNRPMIEGIGVSGIFQAGFMLNYGAFAEASVRLAAHDAEWPLHGVHVQVVTKAGGNRYHATVHADYEDRRWQSYNIDADQVARGVAAGATVPPRAGNRLWRYHDVNADIGGYIRKNLLWWYFSGRDQHVATTAVNFPLEPQRTHSTNYNGKVTAQARTSHRIVIFGQVGRTRQPNRLDPFGPVGGTLSATTALYDSEHATLNQLGWGWVGKAEGTSVLNDSVLFELRAGAFGADRTQTPNGTGPRFEDLGTLTATGGNRSWQEMVRRPQLFSTLSYFKQGWLGTHEFKFGGEFFQTTRGERWRQGFEGDVLHVLRNGAPVEVYLLQTPSLSESGVRSYGAYVSDAWRVNDRLSLMLGLRLDRYRVFLPAQSHPAGRFNPTEQTFAAVENVLVQTAVVPRVGAIVSLSRDGRTVAKLNYACYSKAPGIELTATINPNSDQWWRRHAWSDRNGSGLWDAGEEGRLLGARGGLSFESLEPNLELGLIREATLSIERELGSTIGLRMGAVWRRDLNGFTRQDLNRPFDAFTIPVMVRDPGADGTVDTNDDGPELPAYDLPPEVMSLAPSNRVRNVSAAGNQYWAVDVSAVKHFSGRWSLTGGFEHTWSREHSAAYFGQSVRNNVYPLTPNDLINTGDNGRHQFRTWSVKLHGTYDAPWGVRLTPVLRHQSGQPFGRTFSAPLRYGSVRILAEPVGTRRMDHLTIVDLRLEKGFRLPGRRRVAGFVDVFNVFNTNAEQNASWSSGSFLRPLTIVPPRIARIGAKLDW
jgi:hypothetical protein